MERIGAYEILEKLGSGGMGTVYRARHLETGQVVALKVMRQDLAEDVSFLRRFRREASIARSVASPNIVGVLEVGQEGYIPFIAMELVEGESLASFLRKSGPLPLDQALDIAMQVAQGLYAAHQEGVIHRDISPQNILITEEGTAKIADFGIARSQASATLTGTGTFIGKPSYAAPEMFEGRADTRSDIYSLGVVLFEMLSGRPPFVAPTPLATMDMQVRQAPPRLNDLGVRVPPGLEQVIQTCLEKDPRRRFQAPQDLIEQLRRSAEVTDAGALSTEDRQPSEPTIAYPSGGRIFRKGMTRRALLGAGVAAAVGTAGVLLVPDLLSSNPGPKGPARTAGSGTPSDAGVVGGNPTPIPTVVSTPTSIPVSTSGIPFEAPGTTGGMLRFTGFDALVLDTFDPHLTQFGPLFNGHSAVFSKLYKYVSHSEQILEPDLAADMPEVIGDPNAPTEYIVKLRQGVRFHDPANLAADVRDKVSIKDAASRFPGLAGRELTADDVVWSFSRQKNLASPRFALFYRSSQYGTMEKIEALDKYTLKITTDGPIAPLLHFLGDTNAFIIPREVVDEGRDTLEFPGSEPQSRMIGTGPFVWGRLNSLQEMTVHRNPDWFGWDQPALGRPFLDGYTSFFIVDNASLESLFRDKRIDVAGASGDPQWLFDIKDEQPELEFLRETASGWVNTRFKVFDNASGAPCAPWSDPRLRQAVHLATDRQQVMDLIWAGEAAPAGPVGPAITKWALPPEELEKIPGYRFGRQEREEDLALARQLYEQAGSPQMEFIFADQPSYIPDFAPSFIEGLRQNLGAGVTDQVIRAYPQIAEGLLRGCDTMIATWWLDNGWIDLDDWVYPYFHTGGPKNSFGVSDPDLDALLDAQRREFDEDARREIGYQIQRYLLGVKPDGSGPLELNPNTAAFARLDYAAPIVASVSWPYYRNRYTWPWFGNNHWIANAWLNRDGPIFSSRP